MTDVLLIGTITDNVKYEKVVTIMVEYSSMLSFKSIIKSVR